MVQSSPTNMKDQTFQHTIIMFLVIICIITSLFSNSDETDSTAEKMKEIEQLCQNNINWAEMGPQYSNLNECINRSRNVGLLLSLNGYNVRYCEGCDYNGEFIHAWVMIKINTEWYDFEPYSLRFGDNSRFSNITVYHTK